MGAGGAEVDLVGADAKSAHGQQVRRRLEGGGAHVGVAPDAEHVDVRQALGQLGFPEGAVQGLDLVARLGQQGGGVGMDVFQQ